MLGAGLPKYQSFERQAWAYRETRCDFVRSREAADPESPHLLFLPGYLSREPLDGRPLPRFQEQRLAVGEGMRASRGPLLLLVLETAGALFFARWAVQRMEISG